MKNDHHWQNMPLKSPDPKAHEGFVYRITQKSTGKIYIGKKSFWKRSKNRIVGESNWRLYKSSSKILARDIKETPDDFEYHVMRICPSRKSLTYWEIVYQIDLRVLHQDSYNDSILGKFYRRDVDDDSVVLDD